MNANREILKVSLQRPRHQALDDDLCKAVIFSENPKIVLGNSTELNTLVEEVRPAPDSLFGPRSAVVLSDGSFWIADTGHHRLLGWKCIPDEAEAAEWIIGQNDFYSEGRNGNAKVRAHSVNVPVGLCRLGDGMALADSWNNRILIWSSPPKRNNQNADLVIGQVDFNTGENNQGSSHPSASSLHWPSGIFSDGKRLFVADTGNRRVLIWNRIPEKNNSPADIVLGQNDFDTRDENAGRSPSDMSMRWPHAITYFDEKLCVADAGNNRIMIWDGIPASNGEPCYCVLGQNDFSSSEHNQANYWPNAGSLNMPYGLAAAGDWLLVADTANSRILAFHKNEIANGAKAFALLGQRGMHEKGDNRWCKASSDSLCWPYSISLHEEQIIICDSGNNRVSIWGIKL